MPNRIRQVWDRLMHGAGGGAVAPTAMPVNTLTPRVGEARMMDDVAWSESLIYASTNWPKYNPDSLIGRQGFGIYRKMMLDEQVKAVVRFKRDAITARNYYFEIKGLEEDESLQERIDLFIEILRQMEGSFLDVLNGIMSAHYQGFSMSEIVIKPIEYQGKTWLGLKHIRVKPFESFFFNSDEFSNLLYVSQKWLGKEQEIDMGKFIHHVQNPDIDPHYGQSELREAYRAWFSKDMAIRFQNIFLERSASGFIWITPKEGFNLPNKGTPDYNNLVSVITNMQAKTAIILPGQLELHYQAPASTSAFDEAITGYDRGIARSQLVPNLLGLTEHGKGGGGYAQSQTQLEAFLWTLDAEAARLAETLNEQLFKPLGEQNWGDGVYPCLKFKPVSITMKLNIIKVWQSLISGGSVQHTDSDDAWLREQLDVPEAGEPILPLAPQALVGPDGKLLPAAQDEAESDLAPGGQPKKKPVGDSATYDETVRGRGSLKTRREDFGFDPDQERDEGGKWTSGFEKALEKQNDAIRMADPEINAAQIYYSNKGYDTLNSKMRSGRKLSKEEAKHAAALNRSVKPLSQDVTVYRGMGGKGGVEVLQPSVVFIDRGFVSTSISLDKAKEFGVVTKISLPKGTKAAYLGAREKELLLGTGHQFKVISNTGKVIHLRLVK